MIWQHGEGNLKIFLEQLNNCHSTIKFTADYSSKEINFLDVKVMQKGDQIFTDLFFKATDTYQYLHSSSCHVDHSKLSFPYSQALRLYRICSENEFFDQRCNDLEKWLQEEDTVKKWYENRFLRQGNLVEKTCSARNLEKMRNLTYFEYNISSSLL